MGHLENSYLSVFVITFWNYVALIINVFVYVLLFKKAKHSCALRAFFKIQFFIVVWTLGEILKMLAPAYDIKWFAVKIYYIGEYFSAISFLEFAYLYYNGKHLDTKLKLPLYLSGILQYVVVFTNSNHHLFFENFTFWNESYGVLFYVNAILSGIYVVFGFALCFIKNKRDDIRLTLAAKLSILVPALLHIAYISTLLERFTDAVNMVFFDITPVVYSLGFIVFLYLTFKYEIVDLSNIMKSQIVAKFNVFLVIVDENDVVLYSNDKFDSVFDEFDSCYIGDCVKDGILEYKGKFYEYYVNSFVDLLGEKRIIVFNDITDLQLAKKQLVDENKQLENANKQLKESINRLVVRTKINAKNYVLRDMHDVIGHSLVVVMKLLEVCKLAYGKDNDIVVTNIKNAYIRLDESYREIYNEDGEKSKKYDSFIVEKELMKILDVTKIGNIKTEFYASGYIDYIDENVYNAIRKVITEAITNAIKYSQATTILLNVIFNESLIRLSFIDDGKGCEKINAGNGLRSITTRINNLGGKVEYYTGKDEGFSIYIYLPIND